MRRLKRVYELSYSEDSRPTLEMSAASDSVQLVRMFKRNHEEFYKKYKDSTPPISPRVSELLIRDIIQDLKESKYSNYRDVMKTLVSLMYSQLKKKDQKELASDVQSLHSDVPKKDTSFPKVDLKLSTDSYTNYEFYTGYSSARVNGRRYEIGWYVYQNYIQNHPSEFTFDRWGDISYITKQTPEEIANMLDKALMRVYKIEPSLKEKLSSYSLGVIIMFDIARVVLFDDSRTWWKSDTLDSLRYTHTTVKVSRQKINGKYFNSIDSIEITAIKERINSDNEEIVKKMEGELKSILKNRYNSTPSVGHYTTRSAFYVIECRLSFYGKAYGDGSEEDYIYHYKPSDKSGKIWKIDEVEEVGEYDSWPISTNKLDQKEKEIKLSFGSDSVSEIRLYIHKEWD